MKPFFLHQRAIAAHSALVERCQPAPFASQRERAVSKLMFAAGSSPGRLYAAAILPSVSWVVCTTFWYLEYQNPGISCPFTIKAGWVLSLPPVSTSLFLNFGIYTITDGRSASSTKISLFGHTLLSARLERSKFAIVMSSFLVYSMLQSTRVTSPMSSGFCSLCTVLFIPSPVPDMGDAPSSGSIGVSV